MHTKVWTNESVRFPLKGIVLNDPKNPPTFSLTVYRIETDSKIPTAIASYDEKRPKSEKQRSAENPVNLKSWIANQRFDVRKDTSLPTSLPTCLDFKSAIVTNACGSLSYFLPGTKATFISTTITGSCNFR